MDEDQIKFSDYIIGTMRLGQWGANYSSAEYEKFIRACIDLGYTDFDHADIYGGYTTEAEFGEVLKNNPGLRDQIQLTTKFGIKLVCPNRPGYKLQSYDTSKEHLTESVENSLEKLNTDYLDLYLIHRPDILMDLDEIAEAFTALKQAGKVKHFGVSNFTTHQFDLLNSRIPLATNQVEASVMHLDPFHDGTFDQLQRLNIIPTIWSPFAGGKLFNAETSDQKTRVLEMLNELAKEYDCDIDTLMLEWIKKHPSKPVCILGTTKVERIKKYKEQQIDIAREDWYRIYVASTGKSVA